MTSNARGPGTRAARGGERRKNALDAVAQPIVCSSTYAFDGTAEIRDHFERRIQREEYGRYGNPTVRTAERKIADAGRRRRLRPLLERDGGRHDGASRPAQERPARRHDLRLLPADAAVRFDDAAPLGHRAHVRRAGRLRRARGRDPAGKDAPRPGRIAHEPVSPGRGPAAPRRHPQPAPRREGPDRLHVRDSRERAPRRVRRGPRPPHRHEVPRRPQRSPRGLALGKGRPSSPASATSAGFSAASSTRTRRTCCCAASRRSTCACGARTRRRFAWRPGSRRIPAWSASSIPAFRATRTTRSRRARWPASAAS